MRSLVNFVFLVAALAAKAAGLTWLSDYDEAKRLGARDGKALVLFFPGNGTSAASIELKSKIFGSSEFAIFASRHLLVEMPFPKIGGSGLSTKTKAGKVPLIFPVTAYPTVMLIDARSGDMYGKVVGYVGRSANDYMKELSSFKNTPEARASYGKELRELTAHNQAALVNGPKLQAALAAKDFPSAEAVLKVMFKDATGVRLGQYHYTRASVLMRINPKAKDQALRIMEEALAAVVGDEGMTKTFEAYRATILSGKAAVGPAVNGPAAPASPKSPPASDPSKGA